MVISALEVSEIPRVSINMQHWLKSFMAIKSPPVNKKMHRQVKHDTKKSPESREREQESN